MEIIIALHNKFYYVKDPSEKFMREYTTPLALGKTEAFVNLFNEENKNE